MDTAWSSETPCWGVTLFRVKEMTCPGTHLARGDARVSVQAFCAGPRTLDTKLVWVVGWGAPHLCLQHLKAEEVGPHPVQVPGDLGSAGWPLSSQDAQGLVTRGRRAAPATGQPGGIPSAGRLRDGGGSLSLSP